MAKYQNLRRKSELLSTTPNLLRMQQSGWAHSYVASIYMVVTAAIAVLIVNFDYLGAIAGTIITISAIVYLRSKNE